MAKTKSEKASEAAGRRHAHELFIEASPEEVWKAITDPGELESWFPLEAEVAPGKGGSILYLWGDAWRIACDIQEWAPGQNLRTSWLEAHKMEEGAETPLVVDWHLESEQGGTRLRLVHSGFGPGEEWDEEYDGTKRGWDFELLSLKHYLERHRRKRRRVFWLRRPAPGAASSVWPKLAGPSGICRLGQGEPRKGDRMRVVLSDGSSLDGRLFHYAPPTDLACALKSLGDGLLRVGWESYQGHSEAQIWVSLWGRPAEEAESLRGRLEETLREAVE